ncbi:MAG TPA: beta-eliminating lyase-related protein [Casimicrobiaceae bacterium]|nr:beta-eliminating lyase-related protein [Casimicrobiaceae bacterium]
MINLLSDNVGPIPPESLAALHDANQLSDLPYGSDSMTRAATEALSRTFDRRVIVTTVPTGTAANALSMSVLCRPYGSVFASDCAHIHIAEPGSTEFFTGGAKIRLIPATDGRIEPVDVDDALTRAGKGERHRSPPDAVSLTNGTELGTVYTPVQVQALAAVAQRHRVNLHVDGARFANALARLRCTPGELTWRAGVDVLSLGMTKNVAMGFDVVVCFDETLGDEVAYRARRAGYTFSRMQFLSAQLIAALKDDRWIRRAGDANSAAARIADGLRELPEVTVLHPVDINIVFLRLPERAAEGLAELGLRVSHRGGGLIRLVTSWATNDAMITATLGAFKQALVTAREN